MDSKKLRAPLLVGAIAAVAATAWATGDSYSTSSTSTVVEREVVAIPAGESISPNETVIASETTTLRISEPQTRQPAITIEERRLSNDERIQLAVMDLIANHPSLSGRIGVVSEDAVVTLTGYTTTSGQRDRAGREAGRVEGVRHVVNEIRPRIGAITS